MASAPPRRSERLKRARSPVQAPDSADVMASWILASWIQSQALGDALALAIRSANSAGLAGSSELDYMREMGRSATGREELGRLLAEGAVNAVAGVLWEGCLALAAAATATPPELQSKFVQLFSI